MFLKIIMTAKEPLSVGLESIGIKTLLYKIPVVLKNGKSFEIPIIPGNSFRGILRDTMSLCFIKDISNRVSSKIEIDAGTALTMFSGGLLSRRGESKVDSVIGLIEEYTYHLLPLSILGFAVSNTIIPGKIKVGCGYPVIKEIKELIDDLYPQEITLSLENIYTSILLTRKDDTEKISQIDLMNINWDSIGAPSTEGEVETGALQQRMEREAVIPGVEFVTFIRDILPLRPEEQGLIWRTLEEIRSVGGSIARGFGEIEISFLNQETKEESKRKYEEFMENNKDKIITLLNSTPTDY